MGRILAIDYGRRRTGLAVTDPLQIVPGALDTVPTHQLMDYLNRYLSAETVDCIVIGRPVQMNHEASDTWGDIAAFAKRLAKRHPNIPIKYADERFTSVLAQRTIRESGIGRQRRQQDKGLVDRISATIILQSYLDGLGTAPDSAIIETN